MARAGGIAGLIGVVIILAATSFMIIMQDEKLLEQDNSHMKDVTKHHDSVNNNDAPFVFPSHTDPSTVRVQFHNLTGLKFVANAFFSGGTCDSIRNDEDDVQFQNHSTHVDIQFGCLELFQKSGLGTGNFLSAFYGIRMNAQALGDKIDVSMVCSDADETKANLITPWLMGHFPRRPGPSAVSADDSCRDYKSVPIGYQWRDMVFEMRRMAIAMVGIPSPDHPSAAWAEENLWSAAAAQGDPRRHGHDRYQLSHPQKGDAPLFPNTQIDDAVLHFRCGDIIFSNHPSFGFMKFGSFSRHISPQARRIGIVTQPFEAAPGALQRKDDSGPMKRKRCKIVVEALQEHLQERFPQAEVNIWNSLNESIAQTFARMIMANQTIVGITSFGVFPGVTTFGTGYVRYPDYVKAPNRWLLTSPIVEQTDNVVLIKEPILFCGQAKKKWGQDGSELLEWFRTYPTEESDDKPKEISNTNNQKEEETPVPPANPVSETGQNVPGGETPAPDATTQRVSTVGEGFLLSESDPNAVVVRYHNTSGTELVCSDLFGGQTCKTLWGEDKTIEAFNQHDTLIDVRFNCYELFKKSALGTGNYISGFYSMLMTAHAMGARADLSIVCDDAFEQRKELILPWIMGKYPRMKADHPLRDHQASVKEGCDGYTTAPVGYKWREMTFAMRRMAIAMVGIPSPDHPSAAWAEKNLWSGDPHLNEDNFYQLPHPQKGDVPFYPNVTFDDAVLHFRCGDIITSNHPSFGFMKFGSFSRHISTQVRTIGIVTQPFEVSAQSRIGDRGPGKRERCKIVVTRLMAYLQERFPNAKINLWNDVDETITLAFARMIMANQTIVAISSFGVFPGVTTFGTGYIRKPDYHKAPNRWLVTSPVVEEAGNVVLIDEPRLMSGQAKRMWGEDGADLLSWFENYDQA